MLLKVLNTYLISLKSAKNNIILQIFVVISTVFERYSIFHIISAGFHSFLRRFLLSNVQWDEKKQLCRPFEAWKTALLLILTPQTGSHVH